MSPNVSEGRHVIAKRHCKIGVAHLLLHKVIANVMRSSPTFQAMYGKQDRNDVITNWSDGVAQLVLLHCDVATTNWVMMISNKHGYNFHP